MSPSTSAEPRRPATVRRPPRVLVVDDEADLRELLSLTLVRMGLDVDTADSLAAARVALAAHAYALCLTDMRLPDGTGLELVREVGAAGQVPIAVITAFGSAENAVAALKAGAFDYLSKPVDLAHLRQLVTAAVRELPAASPAQSPAPIAARLLGESPAMQAVRSLIGRLARSMAPVVVYGESGSGKELAARAIHEASSRASGPFVAVNCGAIPETLMEAEFFGYRKGAFTGADRDREGFFQAAASGTLFLDEVAELPLAMQVKLLRAMQERRVRKLGGGGEDAVDVRVISATHQDLAAMVAAARFRQDLYYRLAVIELRLPPLRERPDDIAPLARAILQRVAQRVGAADLQLTPAAIDALAHYRYPGNVRELENILERAVALAAGDRLTAEDLMLPGAELASVESAEDDATADDDVPPAAEFRVIDGVPDSLPAYLDELEREAIRAALVRTHHNRTAAAQLLGVTFRQLRYRMQRLGIK